MEKESRSCRHYLRARKFMSEFVPYVERTFRLYCFCRPQLDVIDTPVGNCSALIVRRCYVCGMLGHMGYECEVMTGMTREDLANVGYRYSKKGECGKCTSGKPYSECHGQKQGLSPPRRGMVPPRAPQKHLMGKVPRGPRLPPPLPPPPPPPHLLKTVGPKAGLSEKQKAKEEKEEEERKRRASQSDTNSTIDLDAIKMVLNQERPAQNTEYVVCKRTGDKIRADTWESYSNSLSTEIMPYMFLGGERNAGNHKELGFRTHCGFVLNLAWEVANFFPGEFEYLKLGLSDFSDNATALYDQLEIAMKFIDRSRENNSSVLVHCVQGISRSSTIVIAYLMTRESMSLQEAYKHVKDRRSLIRPNKGFLRALMKLENKIRGSCSIKFEDYYPPDEVFCV